MKMPKQHPVSPPRTEPTPGGKIWRVHIRFALLSVKKVAHFKTANVTNVEIIDRYVNEHEGWFLIRSTYAGVEIKPAFERDFNLRRDGQKGETGVYGINVTEVRPYECR